MRRSWDISCCDCGNRNRYFKREHDLFPNPKCFFVLKPDHKSSTVTTQKNKHNSKTELELGSDELSLAGRLFVGVLFVYGLNAYVMSFMTIKCAVCVFLTELGYPSTSPATSVLYADNGLTPALCTDMRVVLIFFIQLLIKQ